MKKPEFPLNVNPRRVDDLKAWFPKLTDYEALHLLMQEEIRETLDLHREDYRRANVVTDPSVNPAIPAPEKLVIVFEELISLLTSKLP